MEIINEDWGSRTPEEPFYLSELGLLETRAKVVFWEAKCFMLDYPYPGTAGYRSKGAVLLDAATGDKYVVLRFTCHRTYPDHKEESFYKNCSYRIARLGPREILSKNCRKAVEKICKNFTNNLIFDNFD